MSFRDSTVVIIETSRTVVRAGLGLHELLKIPTVEIQARVGLRPNVSNGNEGLVAVDGEASTSRAPSQPPQKASVNDYLVGAQLDEALASGQNIHVFWPFEGENIQEWTQAEAIWKHVLFNQLQRRRAQNESPVILTIQPGMPRSTYEKICQIFFERFNVAGFAIVERPMAQIYAGNSLSGVVVDIGYNTTDITPIYEGFIIHSARSHTDVGIRHCEIYLANLLRSNTSVMSVLSPPEAMLSPEDLQQTLLDFSKYIWSAGYVKVPSSGETAIVEDEGVTDIAAVLVAGKEKAVIESGMKKKANAKASAAEQARAREIEALDLVTIQFRDKSITLGKERHRFCEPLFDPMLLATIPPSDVDVPLSYADTRPIQEATGHAVSLADIDQRLYIWQGLFVTGDLTKNIKGIAVALQSRLAPFISNPELQTEIQPRSIRILGVPEYYPEYRDTGEGYAAFLGASITAKIIFNDNGGKNSVSKADYTTKGPHAIIEFTPALL
ncbi:actin-like ATPase domain-containing protein [Armillaria gallica]|uniref:Actin-like ATPase domain-containing protein n=1 Tax=Armillaria gallica TaxID=47427 RepID=A0A2H3DZ41_ARMGA|nr:actin-like ATPase domain-containing protein [Armillaria gallica]